MTEVSALVPDQGVQAQMQANTTALKDARSKIQAAQKDLTAARNDATMIVKGPCCARIVSNDDPCGDQQPIE